MRRIFNKSGFTLIEALIALALTSVILAVLYGSFFASQGAIEKSEKTTAALAELRSALSMLHVELESSVIVGDGGPVKIIDKDFYGRPASELSFVTLGTSMPGAAHVTYRVKETEGRLVLVKEIRIAFRPESEAQSAEVIDGLESFKVKASEGGREYDVWQEGRMPESIRVDIRIKDGAGLDLALYDTARPKAGRPLL